jgi:hypothetical protein
MVWAAARVPNLMNLTVDAPMGCPAKLVCGDVRSISFNAQTSSKIGCG